MYGKHCNTLKRKKAYLPCDVQAFNSFRHWMGRMNSTRSSSLTNVRSSLLSTPCPNSFSTTRSNVDSGILGRMKRMLSLIRKLASGIILGMGTSGEALLMTGPTRCTLAKGSSLVAPPGQCKSTVLCALG